VARRRTRTKGSTVSGPSVIRRGTRRAPLQTHAAPPGAVAFPSPIAIAPPPGSEHARSIEEQFEIPNGYGDDRLVLLVKDPWWLFAYWEVQPQTERAARSQLRPEEIPGLQTILRVSDITEVTFPEQPAHRAFDIPLSGLTTNWYIHVNAPNRAFVVELGLLARSGRFIALLRSNVVRTPRAEPSDVIDEAWMITEEESWKLMGPSLGMGSSPGSMGHLMARQLLSHLVSSSGLTSAIHPSLRGFWVRVSAELVIYGATEPKAAVLVQGEAVTVRKDGTFALRMALPEGTQAVTVDVTSADGRKTTSVTPVVTQVSGTLAGGKPGARPAARRSEGTV